MSYVVMEQGIKMDIEEMLLKRKSTRLRDFDYNSEGAYFITICGI